MLVFRLELLNSNINLGAGFMKPNWAYWVSAKGMGNVPLRGVSFVRPSEIKGKEEVGSWEVDENRGLSRLSGGRKEECGLTVGARYIIGQDGVRLGGNRSAM